ncbi:MAG: response regulator [Polyangiales bacterium]
MSAKPRVLVVEDDLDVRLSLAEVLADNDYEPILVSNGREALNHLRTQREKPRLILLDVMMPVMDGSTFRAEQLSDPELRSIPVVVLSAHADVEAAAKAMSVTHFMRKPVDLDDLIATLRKFC